MTVTACRHRVARNGMFALFLCGAMAAPRAAARADMGKGVSGARVRLKSRTAMVDIRQVFRDVGQAVESSVVNIEMRGKRAPAGPLASACCRGSTKICSAVFSGCRRTTKMGAGHGSQLSRRKTTANTTRPQQSASEVAG